MKDYWELAGSLKLQTSTQIVGGFSLGFDKNVPDETKNHLIDFAYWVEDHYRLPVTVWVDFLHRHYLMDRNKKRVGFKFYWVEFEHYPVFEKEADIPVIELPVRLERKTLQELLYAFIEALTLYFAWLCGENPDKITPEPAYIEQILERYLAEGKKNA